MAPKWSPRRQMGVLKYIRFKLRMWTEVQTLPIWVFDATVDDYWSHDGFQTKTYRGDSLEYKVEAIGEHDNSPHHPTAKYEVRIR